MISGRHAISWLVLYEFFSWVAKRGDVYGDINDVAGRIYNGESFTRLVKLRRDVELGSPRSCNACVLSVHSSLQQTLGTKSTLS